MINILGCASIARALSGHIDKRFDDQMKKYFEETFPMNVEFLAPYPDLFSFASILMLTCKYFNFKTNNFRIYNENINILNSEDV